MNDGHGREQLLRQARRLEARRRGGKVPALALFTDPARTPDVLAAAGRLPRGAMVVYRAFGAADAVATGLALRRLTRRRGLILLVGADARLARRIGADGVHLPERLAHRAGRLKRARPGWRVTAAAHGAATLRRAARAGADAVFVSPAFASRSPSAGRPLGALRLAGLARATAALVHALGGVNGWTARRLVGTRVAGLAAVEALS